jgi:hypothetical protein
MRKLSLGAALPLFSPARFGFPRKRRSPCPEASPAGAVSQTVGIYSAVGDYPAALETLKAQKQVPSGDAVNAEAIKLNLDKLKRGEDINK